MTRDPKRYGNAAIECQALAAVMSDPGARAAMLRTAATYQRLAQWFDAAPWQAIGDVAQRVVDQCGQDIRDHNIKIQSGTEA